MVSTSAMVAIEQQLLYFLDSLPSGKGRLVVVEGPQGFGKSHLLGAVYHQGISRGCAMRRARGVPGGPPLALASQLTERVVDPEVRDDRQQLVDLGLVSVFLIHMDGRLIAHASRESLGADEDITSSMLTAIRGFVDHRLTTARHAELDQISVGAYRILMVSGAHTYLAAVVRPTGEERPIRRLLRRNLQGIEARYGSYLALWHGELRGPLTTIVDEVASVLAPTPVSDTPAAANDGSGDSHEDIRRGVPGGAGGSAHATAPPNREEIEDAMRTFLAELPRAGGVIVVDDLEEVDASSTELLQFLVRATVDHPLLVVVGHRSRRSAPGLHPIAARLLRRWARERAGISLSLPSWSVADIQAVLEQVTLGQRWPVITPLVLRQVCQGHPGNTRSMILQWEQDPSQVRQLFAEGALDPTRLYDPQRIDPWPEVISSLDRPQRQVLAALHLWDGPLPIERLVTISEVEELTLWDQLESLLERDLLTEEAEGFALVSALRPMGLRSLIDEADEDRILWAVQGILWEPLLASATGPALFNLMAQRAPHGPPPTQESVSWARRWLRLHARGVPIDPTDLRVRLLHGCACWVIGDLAAARGVLEGSLVLDHWGGPGPSRPPAPLPPLPPAQEDQLDRFRRRLLAQVALTAGDVAGAALLVERLPPAPVTQSTPLFPAILARQRARILLASGQQSQAEESLENAERWCYQLGDPFQSALVAMDRHLARVLTMNPMDQSIESAEVPVPPDLPLVQRLEAVLYLARGLEVADRPRGALSVHQLVLQLALGNDSGEVPLQLEKAFAHVGIGRALLELGKPALALTPLWLGCVGLWEEGLVPRAIPVCLALARAELTAGSVIRGRDLAMTAGFLGKRLRQARVEEEARSLLEES